MPFEENKARIIKSLIVYFLSAVATISPLLVIGCQLTPQQTEAISAAGHTAARRVLNDPTSPIAWIEAVVGFGAAFGLVLLKLGVDKQVKCKVKSELKSELKSEEVGRSGDK